MLWFIDGTAGHGDGAMSEPQANGVLQIVRDHSEAFSTQAKLSNRLWLTLMAVTLVVILPTETDQCLEPRRNLPFGIGCTNADLFDPISFFILIILTISFCHAHAGAICAYRRAQYEINKLGEPKSALVEGQRQFFDTLIVPSFSRVGALPTLLLAALHRFRMGNIAAAMYYLALRAIAVLVQLVIPVFANVLAWLRLQDSPSVPGWVQLAGTVIGVITLVVIVQIAFAELSHTVRTVYRLAKRELGPPIWTELQPRP